MSGSIQSRNRARWFPGVLFLILSSASLTLAGESWPSVLSEMPLEAHVRHLNRTNCVELMLHAFRSNQVVKAMIFMPGATDEFYMFRRAKADLTNSNPSLLDALIALTNQTLIRVSFYPPLLLLHTDEDPLQPDIAVENERTADKLKRGCGISHLLCNDRDWDYLQPLLSNALWIDLRPWRHSYDSWHFYRHSFAAWGLTGWEALETAALAGKSKFKIQRNRVIFEVDPRVRATPHFGAFPR